MKLTQRENYYLDRCKETLPRPYHYRLKSHLSRAPTMPRISIIVLLHFKVITNYCLNSKCVNPLHLELMFIEGSFQALIGQHFRNIKMWAFKTHCNKAGTECNKIICWIQMLSGHFEGQVRSTYQTQHPASNTRLGVTALLQMIPDFGVARAMLPHEVFGCISQIQEILC